MDPVLLMKVIQGWLGPSCNVLLEAGMMTAHAERVARAPRATKSEKLLAYCENFRDYLVRDLAAAQHSFRLEPSPVKITNWSELPARARSLVESYPVLAAVRETPTPDVQGASTPPAPEPGSVPAAEQAIEDAFESATTPEKAGKAVQSIERIWQRLDKVRDLAEARSRILLARVTPPPLAADPGSLEKLKKLEDSLANSETGGETEPVDPTVIRNAVNLVGACLADHQVVEFKIEAERVPTRSVLVTWEVFSSRLQWTISESSLPWPGVTVRTLSAIGEKCEFRMFHNAFSVVRHFRGYLVQAERATA